MTDAPHPPMSILQQAQLIDGLARRCVLRGGVVALETHTTLSKDEAVALADLSRRLYLIAPFEAEIRRVVTGR